MKERSVFYFYHKKDTTMSTLWQTIQDEAKITAEKEMLLTSFLFETILNHQSLSAALSFHLATKLSSDTLPSLMLKELIQNCFDEEPSIIAATHEDLQATFDRDPATKEFSTIFLYYKGFHALQSYRVANWLWHNEHKAFALCLQNRISEVFGVDIHPAAKIGKGILIDHATGIVIGETAVVKDNVSMLHSVTLGGTGKECGDRHPKIESGVLIGAGAKILGNIIIGEGAKVGAGSVVLKEVPPHATVAGVPAQVVGKPDCDNPALLMNHCLE